MSKARTANDRQLLNAYRAHELLKEARTLLAHADCPKTLARVNLAVSSVKGAVRNIEHRHYKTRNAA